MLNVSRLLGIRLLAVALMVGLLSPAAARADDTLGGHFGIVLPLVTRAGGETLSIGNQFKIGFPIGITIKTGEKVAFDLELVPTIQRTPYVVTLTVHPGILYALPNDFAAGIRMAFDVNQSSWGVHPAAAQGIRHGWKLPRVRRARRPDPIPGREQLDRVRGAHRIWVLIQRRVIRLS